MAERTHENLLIAVQEIYDSTKDGASAIKWARILDLLDNGLVDEANKAIDLLLETEPGSSEAVMDYDDEPF